MAQHSTADYEKLAKSGFLFGAGLFVFGVLGGVVAPAFVGSLSGWEQTLFLYAEIVGTVIGLFSPILFGIVFPLVS